jgi:hypothetical protein
MNKQNLLEGLAGQAKHPTDVIPARLTENEYVIPADVVIALGDGDVEQGIQFLDELVQDVRQKTQGTMAED